MRIIAGELKGRKLVTPKDDSVRPTTDKVKEAVFSMLMPYLQDSVVIDLFAGTGSLGLEAVSRGAKRAYFVDRDRRSIALIRENVRHCGVEDRSVILCSDHASALSRIHDTADIVFLDPPYKAGLMTECLQLLGSSDILPEGGLVVAEHDSYDCLPEEFAGFRKIKERKYGKIGITVYEQEEK